MFTLIERKITSLRASNLVGSLILLALVKIGVWHIPNVYLLKHLAENPFRNPYEGVAQYLFTNWLGAFFAWLVSATSGAGYTFLHTLFSCLFLAINFVSLRRSIPDTEWRKAVCLFMCFPVSWTHLYWIGYDSLTLALLSLILISLRRPWVTCLFGIGVGLQHASQGLIALGGLLFVVAFNGVSGPDRRREGIAAATAIVGLGVGWIVLHIIINVNRIELNYDRSNWLADNGREVISNNLYTFWTFLYCLCGPGWFVLFRYFEAWKANIAFLSVLFACAAVTFMTDDVTRVFAVLSYPALAYCLLYNGRWLVSVSYREVSMVVGLWLVTPWLYDWAGKVRTTVLFYDLAFCMHETIGWPTVVADTPFFR